MHSPKKFGRSSRLPEWLRTGLPTDPSFGRTRVAAHRAGLHTVCQEARCPNMGECFSRGTATFLVMGPECTRNCTFCNVTPGAPAPLDPAEPQKVAAAAAELKLAYVVITSVTRDDLPDGGAAHFAACVRAVRERLPTAGIEVLIPDFRGDEAALRTVLESAPTVLNHNIETVPRLYPAIRPQADYAQSLELLRRAADAGATAKSGLMVGLGETDAEVQAVLADLRRAGVSIVTIGQYLRPSRVHPEPVRYVHPDVFEHYAERARELGMQPFSGPLVRSSYRAGECCPGTDV